jgi:ribose-phosphate pyrophosphokinase
MVEEHGEDFGIVSGGVYPELAEQIAEILEKPLVDLELKKFSNGERYARFKESVRKRDLFVVQSMAEMNGYSLNDAIMETLLIVDAAKRASADWVTVVWPLMPYARQDRKARNREPISVSVLIRALEVIGTNRIVTVDLHSAQSQAIFNRPFDHLTAEPLISERLAEIIGDKKNDYVVVSPDAGRAKESEQYSDELGVELIHMPKSRDRMDSSILRRPLEIDGIEGKTCIVIDDMIDTGGTIISAAETLKNSGAKGVILAATHGILSGNALEKFQGSSVEKLILVDTLPQEKTVEALGSRVEILPVAPMIAESLRRVLAGESVAELFHDMNNK